MLGTLAFAPVMIALFYSAKFEGAVELLRWLCLGMTMRVISWPMGFIIVAKNAQRIFFISELAWTAVYLALAWTCITAFGLNGVGIAFFGSYVFHVAMVYCIVRRISGFRWSSANAQTCFFYLVLIAVVFASFYVLPSVAGNLFGHGRDGNKRFLLHSSTGQICPNRTDASAIIALACPFASGQFQPNSGTIPNEKHRNSSLND